MSFYHRSDVVFVNDANGDPDWGASYTVTVYPVGAVASANSSGSVLTVDNGHSINAGGAGNGDKIAVWDGTTFTFVATAVTAATATTITIGAATASVSAGDKIVNLGPDTASGSTANFDASPVPIFSDADGGSAISNSKVTADSTVGSYDYWYKGDGAVWEVIRDSTGTVQSVVPGYDAVAGRRNIVDYGAAMDGTTDDSSRVLSTCLAASSRGDTVFVPQGTALMDDVSANLSGDGTVLKGEGWGSVLKAGSNEAFTGNSMILVTANNTQIRDIKLDGARIAQHCVELTGTRSEHSVFNTFFNGGTIAGWRVQGAANVITGLKFTDCLMDDCDYGVYVVDTASSRIRVRGCTFLSSTVSDTIIGATFDRDCFDIHVEDCHSEAKGFGYAFASCTDWTIMNCTATGQTDTGRGKGIHVESTTAEIDNERGRIIGCDCTDVENQGIGTVAAADTKIVDLQVIGNYCEGKASAANPAGIDLDDVENLVCTGNIVNTFDGNGINLLPTNSKQDNALINSNLCYNNNISANASGANINVGSGCTEVLVEGNRCYDDQGTPTVRYHVRVVPTDGTVKVVNNFVDANAVTSAYDYDYEIVTTTGTMRPDGITAIDTTAGILTATLPAGEEFGEIKVVWLKTDGGDATISVTNHVTSDPETFTLDDANDMISFVWLGTQWQTFVNSGAAIP